MMRFFQIAALALLFAGCDPGGHYALRGGRPVRDDGLRYVVAGPEGTSLRVYGSWFTSTLTIEVEVTNLLVQPLVVRPAGLRAFDRDGHEFDSRGSRECLGRPGAAVALSPNEICKIRAHYSSRIKKMERVTVVHDGLLREGRVLTSKLALEDS